MLAWELYFFYCLLPVRFISGWDFILNPIVPVIESKKEWPFRLMTVPIPVIHPLSSTCLKQQGIQAAFFVVGNKLENNREIIRRIDQEGHIMGGHSFSHHFFFDLFPARRMKIELKQTEEIVMKITGKKMKLFRPPYGVTNPVLARVIRKLGYQVIGWSLKSKDTVTGDSQVLLDRLKKKVKSGDLILFHDTKPVLSQSSAFLYYFSEIRKISDCTTRSIAQSGGL